MKILVIGAHGMLGRSLVGLLSDFPHAGNPGYEVVAAGHGQIDVTNASSTPKFITHIMPEVIVNCTAFSNVDACETQISEAFAVNAAGPGNIARAGKDTGAKTFHISSDYVFDGTKGAPYLETDKPNPLSVYGKSKLEGEIAVQRATDNYAIIRTAWLFGPYRKNFVTTMLDLGRKNGSVSVVSDQYGCPTYTADLSLAIQTVIARDLRGLYHVVNAGYCSRLEWAQKIFEFSGTPVSVIPIKSTDYQRPARAPQNSSLDCAKYAGAVGHEMRPWQDALGEYIKSGI
jgi:dTDP-4-dehydrorhamnose reductase